MGRLLHINKVLKQVMQYGVFGKTWFYFSHSIGVVDILFSVHLGRQGFSAI
jgi:hypothetical protein